MELTTLIISYLALGWLIAKFEPLHWVIDYVFIQWLPESKFMQYVHASFGCWKCTSFWTALAISGNIYVAAITSMVAYLISQWTND
jgi:anti-sigma-K factor RskA